MKPNLEIDITNLLGENIGYTYGLTTKDSEENQGLIKHIDSYIREKREKKEIGFYELPDNESLVKEIYEYKNSQIKEFDTLLVLGIGGSALGVTAIKTALCHPIHNELPKENRKGLKIYVLDNIDPDYIYPIIQTLDIEKTLVNVITKSGSTAETISQFMVVYDIFKRKLKDNTKKHFVFTTDPEKGDLRALSKEMDIKTFFIPPNVGGRFSVLSPVGLLPAAFMDLKIEEMLKGAKDYRNYLDSLPPEKNPAYILGLLLYLFDKRFSIKNTVIMPYSSLLRDIADWFRQLWAESLGKKLTLNDQIVYAGLTPIKALGVTDQHSQIQLYNEGPFDKVILFIEVLKEKYEIKIPKVFQDKKSFEYLGDKTINQLFKSEFIGTKLSLAKNNRPNATIRIEEVNEYNLGTLFFFFEVMTTFTGYLYNIDPFNQPGVEEGKHFTYALMGRKGFEEKRKEIENLSKKEKMVVIK